MDIRDLIDNERKLELKKEIEKELSDLENNIITRRDFILYIYKKYDLLDVFYIIDTFLKPITLVVEPPDLVEPPDPFVLKSYFDEMLFIEYERYEYNVPKKGINTKIKDLKRLPSIENMALKGKKIKKRKK